MDRLEEREEDQMVAKTRKARIHYKSVVLATICLLCVHIVGVRNNSSDSQSISLHLIVNNFCQYVPNLRINPLIIVVAKVSKN